MKSFLAFLILGLAGMPGPGLFAQGTSLPRQDIRLTARSTPYGLIGSAANLREERPFGIAANLGTAAIAGVSVDYFVNPRLNLEAGIGIGQYLAVKYHPFGDRRRWMWSPYIGLAGGHVADWYSPLFDFFSDDRKADHYFGFYLPVGGHFIADGGFSFNVEVACAALWPAKENNLVEPLRGPFGGIRLGYHFY